MTALLLLLMACAPAPADTATPTTDPGCNGDIDLCDRALDDLLFLKTHNSHATEAQGYSPLAMNHFLGIPAQLDLGVRSLNLDIYELEGQLQSCHGVCGLGHQPFVEILDELDTWLAANPDQVILVDFQDEAPDGAISAAITAHPLSSRAHTQVPQTPWPTLQALADAGTPFVVFGDPIDGDPAWFHEARDFHYRTAWAFEAPEDFTCAPDRDPMDHGLYEIVHVLTNPLAHPDNAELVNQRPVLEAHLSDCTEQVGFVNQISVDYVSIGDAVQVVADWNRSAR